MRPILLDLDDTLVDDRKSTAIAFDAFVETHRALLDDRDVATLLIQWRTVFGKHWVRHERGELSFVGQRRARVREFLGNNLERAWASHRTDYGVRATAAVWDGPS